MIACCGTQIELWGGISESCRGRCRGMIPENRVRIQKARDEFDSQLAHLGQTFFAETKESLIWIKIQLNWCVFLVKKSALEFIY